MDSKNTFNKILHGTKLKHPPGLTEFFCIQPEPPFLHAEIYINVINISPRLEDAPNQNLMPLTYLSWQPPTMLGKDF